MLGIARHVAQDFPQVLRNGIGDVGRAVDRLLEGEDY
jgi:hypothetical protein